MSEVATQEYNPELARAVAGRYSDAYIVARGATGLGDVIKVVGIVIGAFIALVSLPFAFKEGGGVLIPFMGIAVGGCIGVMFYLLGTLVAAQGQILKATLDSAVNTSSFLKAADRAAIMSLTRGAAPATSAASRVSAAASWDCECGGSNSWSATTCRLCGAPQPA